MLQKRMPHPTPLSQTKVTTVEIVAAPSHNTCKRHVSFSFFCPHLQVQSILSGYFHASGPVLCVLVLLCFSLAPCLRRGGKKKGELPWFLQTSCLEALPVLVLSQGPCTCPWPRLHGLRVQLRITGRDCVGILWVRSRCPEMSGATRIHPLCGTKHRGFLTYA